MFAYSVYDKKARIFNNPIFQQNDDVAIRSLAASMKETLFSMFPDDYELWCVGEWDDINGEFTPFEKYMVIRVNELTKGEKIVQD